MVLAALSDKLIPGRTHNLRSPPRVKKKPPKNITKQKNKPNRLINKLFVWNRVWATAPQKNSNQKSARPQQEVQRHGEAVGCHRQATSGRPTVRRGGLGHYRQRARHRPTSPGCCGDVYGFQLHPLMAVTQAPVRKMARGRWCWCASVEKFASFLGPDNYILVTGKQIVHGKTLFYFSFASE